MHGLQEVSNLRTRLTGLDIGEPDRIWMRMRGGDDLDTVAIFQLSAQWHHLKVDLRADAAITDVGVYRVGEIDRGRPAR